MLGMFVQFLVSLIVPPISETVSHSSSSSNRQKQHGGDLVLSYKQYHTAVVEAGSVYRHRNIETLSAPEQEENNSSIVLSG